MNIVIAIQATNSVVYSNTRELTLETNEESDIIVLILGNKVISVNTKQLKRAVDVLAYREDSPCNNNG